MDNGMQTGDHNKVRYKNINDSDSSNRRSSTVKAKRYSKVFPVDVFDDKKSVIGSSRASTVTNGRRERMNDLIVPQVPEPTYTVLNREIKEIEKNDDIYKPKKIEHLETVLHMARQTYKGNIAEIEETPNQVQQQRRRGEDPTEIAKLSHIIQSKSRRNFERMLYSNFVEEKKPTVIEEMPPPRIFRRKSTISSNLFCLLPPRFKKKTAVVEEIQVEEPVEQNIQEIPEKVEIKPRYPPIERQVLTLQSLIEKEKLRLKSCPTIPLKKWKIENSTPKEPESNTITTTIDTDSSDFPDRTTSTDQLATESILSIENLQ